MGAGRGPLCRPIRLIDDFVGLGPPNEQRGVNAIDDIHFVLVGDIVIILHLVIVVFLLCSGVQQLRVYLVIRIVKQQQRVRL